LTRPPSNLTSTDIAVLLPAALSPAVHVGHTQRVSRIPEPGDRCTNTSTGSHRRVKSVRNGVGGCYGSLTGGTTVTYLPEHSGTHGL
jgi:hypothetical protein